VKFRGLKMSLGTAAAIGYGVLTLIGGIMGYIKAKSQASLISGLISGSLLIFAGTAQLMGQTWGLTLAAAISAVLAVVYARWNADFSESGVFGCDRLRTQRSIDVSFLILYFRF
jgi:uncharacterized membrane protein (UPF0136 family)